MITQDPGIPTEHPTVPAWQEPAHPLAKPRSKDLPQSVGFAIIGSGITGCNVANTILDCESQIREVTTVATFADEDDFAEVCESIRMYEEAIPEIKGKYTILNKETAKEEYSFKATSGATTAKSHVFWPYRLVINLLQELLLDYSDRFSIETLTPVTLVAI